MSELEKIALLDWQSLSLLNQVMEKFHFSARVYHRIIKVARTIADLDDSQDILTKHVSEALAYQDRF